VCRRRSTAIHVPLHALNGRDLDNNARFPMLAAVANGTSNFVKPDRAEAKL
jgi:hypothetical protein